MPALCFQHFKVFIFNANVNTFFALPHNVQFNIWQQAISVNFIYAQIVFTFHFHHP